MKRTSTLLTMLFWVLPAAAAVALLVGTFVVALPKALRTIEKSPCPPLNLSPIKSNVSLRGVALPDLQGRGHQLTRWKGRLVLLNFWLTTCRPCLEEMPSLLEVANRNQDKGLVLLLVSTDKKKADIDAFIKKMPRLANPPANVVMLHDQGGKLAKRWGTNKYPETYVISPEGRLAGVAVGPRDWTDRAATTCIADKLP